MKISLIVAMADNRAIGLDGQMPWHLSADLKRFKQTTMGSPIMMGRKTFDAIGKPCRVFTSIESGLNYASGCDELFVIGGATLYEALLPIADYLYLTLINRPFEGDTYFPEIDYSGWRELSREDVCDDPLVDFSYSFLKLENFKK